MAAPFDLLVFGQTTRDVLSTSSLNAERIGGVAYAASVAARLELRVGLLASVSDTSEGTIRTALEGRGIDTDGLCSKAQSPLIYEISGASECLDQRTRRLGPGARDLALPETVPDAYCGAKMALIYPVWMPTAVVVARRLKASGTRLAVDFQHDVDTLADAADLLELCDYVFLNTESLTRLTDADTTEGAAAALRNAVEKPQSSSRWGWAARWSARPLRDQPSGCRLSSATFDSRSERATPTTLPF